MKSLLMKTAFAGLCALTAGAASAGVTVNYIESDKFADLPFAPWEREQVLKDLSDYFTKLGAQLPEGQDLAVADAGAIQADGRRAQAGLQRHHIEIASQDALGVRRRQGDQDAALGVVDLHRQQAVLPGRGDVRGRLIPGGCGKRRRRQRQARDERRDGRGRKSKPDHRYAPNTKRRTLRAPLREVQAAWVNTRHLDVNGSVLLRCQPIRTCVWEDVACPRIFAG